MLEQGSVESVLFAPLLAPLRRLAGARPRAPRLGRAPRPPPRRARPRRVLARGRLGDRGGAGGRGRRDRLRLRRPGAPPSWRSRALRAPVPALPHRTARGRLRRHPRSALGARRRVRVRRVHRGGVGGGLVRPEAWSWRRALGVPGVPAGARGLRLPRAPGGQPPDVRLRVGGHGGVGVRDVLAPIEGRDPSAPPLLRRARGARRARHRGAAPLLGVRRHVVEGGLHPGSRRALRSRAARRGGRRRRDGPPHAPQLPGRPRVHGQREEPGPAGRRARPRAVCERPRRAGTPHLPRLAGSPAGRPSGDPRDGGRRPGGDDRARGPGARFREMAEQARASPSTPGQLRSRDALPRAAGAGGSTL